MMTPEKELLLALVYLHRLFNAKGEHDQMRLVETLIKNHLDQLSRPI